MYIHTTSTNSATTTKDVLSLVRLQDITVSVLVQCREMPLDLVTLQLHYITVQLYCTGTGVHVMSCS